MRKEKIKEISDAADDLASSATDLLEYFNKSTADGDAFFNVKSTIRGTDLTYSDCLSRLTTVAEMTSKFEKSNHFVLLPMHRVTTLKQRMDEAKSHLDNLSTHFRQITKDTNFVFKYENFHIQSNNQNHDFRGHFKNFTDATDALLEAFFNVLVILRPSKATYSFQAAGNALSTLIGNASDEIKTVHEKNSTLKKLIVTADNGATEAQEAAEEAKRLKLESEKERRTISEYLADATEKKSFIDSIHQSATTLENEVGEFSDKFSAFDRQLETRNETIENGNKKLEQLFEKFEEQEKSIAELLSQSESMLKGATVAGLASSFSDAHDKLGKQLMWARFSFYVGIFFLFISSIPLMLFVFLPVLAPLIQESFPELSSIAQNYPNQNEATGWQYLGQVLARFIILLPAAWFVSFSSIRHSSLFRLREHYAYKYSMAVSVEGFRKQAQGYENEIAALVLEQLAFNPADKLVPSKEIKEGKIPHPMADVLLSKLRSGVDKGTS